MDVTRPHGSGWMRRLLAALAACAALGSSAPVAAAQASAGTGSIAVAAPITVPFDHLTTGFELDGVHRDLPCEACHLNAVFRGTPRDCGTCHMAGSQFNATPKTTTHVPSTYNCAACHDTIAFRPAVHFDHVNVMGGCVNCHNGTIAQGEGPTHPATTQSCQSCHSVLTWNPPTTVDHSQIPEAVAGFCIVCHNGVQASGKSAGHIATSLECGDCHTTTSWLGASFDHTGITTGCYSCHNGVKAVGKQGSHMPTSNTCENCHTTGIGSSTPSWVPSQFDHTQMTVSTCQTCHSGTVRISTGFVSGQPVNHVPPIPSTIDCGVCHGNTPSAETWTVLAASIPTLHSGLSVSNCLLCHASQTFAGVPAPYIPMSISGLSPYKATPLAPPHIPILAGADCSACHGAAYQAGGFGPATAMSAAKHAFVSTSCDTCHDTGRSFYVGAGTPLQLRPADHLSSTDPRMATGDCSVCHETTDWNSTVLPSGHMPNPGNLGCAQCHASAPADYTPATLAANSVLHTGISGNCGLCHGATTPLTWFNNFTPLDAVLTPAHIPYLSGSDCSACHVSSSYAAGTFGPTAMSAAKHAFVPSTCDTCHEASLNFYMGASMPALQGRPLDHQTSGNPQEVSGDCSGCHETTDWNTNALPPGHMPNPGGQACALCHTAISGTLASYATLASIAVLHTGISSGCAQCHGASSQLSFYNNNDNPKDGVLSPSHIPYLSGTDCGSCHAQIYVAGGFGPMNMTQATHSYVSSTNCDSCHEAGAGANLFMGAASPALQGRPADHTSGQMVAPNDCSLCHSTANWNSTALPAGHMPNPAAQACTLCHTAAPSDYTTATLAANPVLHTGITTGCGQCHGGASALTWYSNFTPKDAVLTPLHIPAFTGTDCAACHAPSTYATGAFGPMNMTQATHAGLGSTCNPCHEANLSFYMGAASPELQGRPADHTSGQMVSPNDCNLCHTSANWNSTALPAGHMPNPANQACALCHTSAPADYSTATLAANPVLHTGISSGCGQCHGGTTALTWYNNFTPKDAILAPAHLQYLAGTDCGSCHAPGTYATGAFGPMNMTQATHAFVSSTNCDGCHEAGAGVNIYMGSASPALQGRPADHTSGQMVAPNDCSLCHTTANWNSTVLPSGHMPNPGNQACALCHTAAPTNYATLAANPVLHTGISSGCITCHGAPNATAPVFYLNYTPKDALLSPVHIPTSTTPCEDCHTATVFTAFSGTTMTSAKHTSMFTVIAKSCDPCHNKVTPALNFYGVTNLQSRPSDHNSGSKLNNDCSGCHNTNSWGGGAQARPAAATAARAAAAAPASPSTTSSAAIASTPAVRATPAAVPGASAMGSALATVSPAAAANPHLGVSGNCVSCHNGVAAAGKGPNHIASNDQCANCHTTIAWIPARFDHRGVTASCASCHNGVLATGKPITHIPTASACGACHGSFAWRPARFTHVGVVSTCEGCHNTLTGLGKPLGHLATRLDCSGCHTTLGWIPAAVPNAVRTPAPGVRGPGSTARGAARGQAP